MVHALGLLKAQPLRTLTPSFTTRVCRELDHEWRDRELDPATTLALFLQQMLHGNVSCAEVRRLVPAAGTGARGGCDGSSRTTFSASAYCQARQRLPLEVIQTLARRVAEAALPQSQSQLQSNDDSDDGLLFHGHRAFVVDGSTASMSDTPELRKAFGQPSGQKAGCGFPVAHLLLMFHLSSGLLLHSDLASLHTSDLSGMPAAHGCGCLPPGDLL